MPTILCSPLQRIILAGFDLLRQVLNLLQCVGNGSCKCPFYPSITCVQAGLCLSSAPLQSQCLHAVTAAWHCHCCFSLWENTAFPTCLLALALQNVMIWVFCLFSSGFVIPLWTGSYVLEGRGKAQLAICSPWVPNGALPQSPGVLPWQISCGDFFCSVCSFPNQPWDFPYSAPGIWQARSHAALASSHPQGIWALVL